MQHNATAPSLIIDGYTGMPMHVDEQHGPRAGSVEWLLQAIERHAASEADALDLYARIADESGDPVVALVMRLILDDELRHHSLLKRIESSLRDALDWSHSPSALPSSTVPRQALPDGLAHVARELVEEERTGARKMRELASKERGIDDGLHSLLLEMMALDSEKHAHLLTYVQRRLAARSRLQDGPSD
jgi:rubrerythrin